MSFAAARAENYSAVIFGLAAFRSKVAPKEAVFFKKTREDQIKVLVRKSKKRRETVFPYFQNIDPCIRVLDFPRPPGSAVFSQRPGEERTFVQP